MLAGSVGGVEVERGQVLENCEAQLRGRVLAIRKHSSNITFLQLGAAENAGEDTADDAAEGAAESAAESEAERKVQICVNRQRCTSPLSLRALSATHVGDLLLCRGHPGRTRTGTDATSLSLFARNLILLRVSLAPPRLLSFLSDVRDGAWSLHEAATLLGGQHKDKGANQELLSSLLTLLKHPLDQLRVKREREREKRPPSTPARQRPARLERVKEAAKRRQGGLILIMEKITLEINVAAMLRTCDAFGVAGSTLTDHIFSPGLSPLIFSPCSTPAALPFWVQIHKARLIPMNTPINNPH